MRNLRHRALTIVALGALALGVAACGGGGGGEATTTSTTTTLGPNPADELRLDQIQVIGTHNSFHQAPPEDEMAQLAAMDATQAANRAYTHLPLGDQLVDQRVRQLELDVFADAQGGLYASPALRPPSAGPLDPLMTYPGTKVLHEQDVDYHSVCPSLVSCLSGVKAWSDANPDHVPLAINIQFKDGPLIFPVADQAKPEPWTSAAMDGLDAEIRTIFEEDDLITPDAVRGDHATLEEAVLDHGWPTLGESRGKVLFLMINPEPYRSTYLEGHPNLEGRILFTNAEPGQPDASYVGIDDPVADGARIRELVEQGYLVRTRADADGIEAKAGDTARLEAALASGAQWVSTDYPGPDGAQAQFGTDYVAQLPGFLAARCNPVTAPEGCEDADVERATTS
ncbi:MAG: phosphatidylinositol-specific phospholipase C1-like protein [Acidimicrobiales bacterium]